VGAHAVSGHPSVSTDSAECVVQVLAVGWVEEGLVRSVLWSVLVEVSHHGGPRTARGPACRQGESTPMGGLTTCLADFGDLLGPLGPETFL